MIKNRKGLYIRLGKNGSPETCCENNRMLFEYSKARNIHKSLPKSMKRMNFQVCAVPESMFKTETENKVINTLSSNMYVASESVTRWIEKFGTCEDVLSEAKKREGELVKLLSSSDDELLDLLHIIEIEPPKDLFSAWKLYKQIRENRVKRRECKDELLIINNVLENINISRMSRKSVERAIGGLFNRKYTLRIIEEDTEGNV